MIYRIHLIISFIFLNILSTAYAQEWMTVPRVSLGKVTAPELNELSGLISSRTHKDCYWVHNDSGDKARIFLLDQQAKLVKTLNLEGISSTDLEDIAWFEGDGKSYLVLADIGDNSAKRKEIKLYVFEEPKFDELDGQTINLNKEDIVIKTLKYADKAKDAEAIFIDPWTLGCYIISKREFQSTVYYSDILKTKGDSGILKPVVKLPFTFVTAADISTDGKQLLVKNLNNIYYWNREANETIAEAMRKPFRRISYQPEAQGEAIGFDVHGHHFFTISERPFGLESYLYQYK